MQEKLEKGSYLQVNIFRKVPFVHYFIEKVDKFSNTAVLGQVIKQCRMKIDPPLEKKVRTGYKIAHDGDQNRR